MSIKQLVNDKIIYDSFLEELDNLIEEKQQTLEKADDQIAIYRAQGAIISLRKLKKLRDIVNARK